MKTGDFKFMFKLVHSSGQGAEVSLCQRQTCFGFAPELFLSKVLVIKIDCSVRQIFTCDHFESVFRFGIPPPEPRSIDQYTMTSNFENSLLKIFFLQFSRTLPPSLFLPELGKVQD